MNNRWNLQRKHPQFSFYRWPRISPGKQGRAFPNCEKTPWKRACLFRETVSDEEGYRRSKKSCSHRTDLLPIYHGWKLEQEALAGIGVRKVSPSRRLNKESAPSLARLQNFQRFSPPTITLRWKMTTALLPARHGSFVIYRPLRFHVIQIFPLAFSKRLRGPIDRSRGYFSIPLSIVSLVKIYPLHGRRQVSPHGVSSTARGVSIRSTLAYLPYLSVEAIVSSFVDDENRKSSRRSIFPTVGDRVEQEHVRSIRARYFQPTENEPVV